MSRRARSRPSGRCALPVVLAAPSGGARLALWAARRSPPGFKRLARRRPALPVGVFAALRAASARSRSCARSRVAVLGRARPALPRWRHPPGLGALRRACARPPRSSGSLRAALRPALSGRPPAAAGFLRSPCALVGLPPGLRALRPCPPCRRAGAARWRPRSRLPRRGLSRRCAALGGLRSAPPPGGGLARCGAPPCCGERAACPRRPHRKMQDGT